MRELASITQLISVGTIHPVYPNPSYYLHFKKKEAGCPARPSLIQRIADEAWLRNMDGCFRLSLMP